MRSVPTVDPLSGRITATTYIEQQLRSGQRPNRLIHERSPYLLQHAFNPVDWYPWGDEAFSRAREEDKPVFLSIGYSTCHWCHVMAHESFENPDIAQILNRNFISIKVDREERPDIDRIYMTFAMALSGAGGWPLSLFLSPDRTPLYAGTYFPPDSRFGRPGFPDLLEAVYRAWKQDRQKLLKSGQELLNHLHTPVVPQNDPGIFSSDITGRDTSVFERNFDTRNGGFGKAPKFPRPAELFFLIRQHVRTGSDSALTMSIVTLRAMALGGMRDHLGGGFHRYSVDAKWRVPHFEKMLYDQAQLASVYLEVFQITGDDFFSRIAEETLDYLLSEMRSAEGGFFSAEDADSALPENPDHRSEGAFYLWTAAQIIQVLGESDARIFSFHFGVEEQGNAPADPHGEFGSRNILFQAHDIEETAREFGISQSETADLIARCSRLLVEVRKKRPRPHLDDKIVTAWNALTISALCAASRVLGKRHYLDAAVDAGEFIFTHLIDSSNGRLLRRYREGIAGLEGQLQDYAFMVQACLDLYQSCFDPRWFLRAQAFQQIQDELFSDVRGGGYFETSAGDVSLIARLKEDYDGAEPSGNSVSAHNLIRMALLTADRDFLGKARKTIQCFSERLLETPTAMPIMASAIPAIDASKRLIIISGTPDDPSTQRMIDVVHRRFLPGDGIILIDHQSRSIFERYLPVVRDMRLEPGKTAAYVCVNYACQLPVHDAESLGNLLDSSSLN